MNKICFTPFPSIATERFNLRPLTIEDENEIFALRSDDSINEYLDRPKANSIDDARKFIHKIIEGISQDESIFWVISSKDNPALAATICLWKISKEHATAEIGYEVLPRFQGKGIMQEVIPKIIEYGFETLKLNAIEAELSPRNLKSVRLLEKYGFVRKDNANKTGEEENPDSVVYLDAARNLAQGNGLVVADAEIDGAAVAIYIGECRIHFGAAGAEGDIIQREVVAAAAGGIVDHAYHHAAVGGWQGKIKPVLVPLRGGEVGNIAGIVGLENGTGSGFDIERDIGFVAVAITGAGDEYAHYPGRKFIRGATAQVVDGVEVKHAGVHGSIYQHHIAIGIAGGMIL